jgi:ribbon-helix-helix CopG family protein
MAGKKTGPRGGKTTRTDSGLVRKTLWLAEDEAEELRQRAFKERTSESELMREALRRFLELAD